MVVMNVYVFDILSNRDGEGGKPETRHRCLIAMLNIAN